MIPWLRLKAKCTRAMWPDAASRVLSMQADNGQAWPHGCLMSWLQGVLQAVAQGSFAARWREPCTGAKQHSLLSGQVVTQPEQAATLSMMTSFWNAVLVSVDVQHATMTSSWRAPQPGLAARLSCSCASCSQACTGFGCLHHHFTEPEWSITGTLLSISVSTAPGGVQLQGWSRPGAGARSRACACSRSRCPARAPSG